MTKKTDVSLSGKVGLSRCVPTHRLISNPIVSEKRPRCQWEFCRIRVLVPFKRHYVQHPSSLRRKALPTPSRFSPKPKARARFDVFPERRSLFCRFKGVTFLMRKRSLKINRRTRSKSPGCAFSGGSLPTDRHPDRAAGGGSAISTFQKKNKKGSAFSTLFSRPPLFFSPFRKRPLSASPQKLVLST